MYYKVLYFLLIKFEIHVEKKIRIINWWFDLIIWKKKYQNFKNEGQKGN